ncbi:DUF6179 domain-containing protein [Sinanaerobacter chloroacetimidivorans]|jgi:hypothetical protein|uniref:Uncharacterized protein n=1 Tax=Sinanaerobacter chloroacetimidivorans TaxID=2818044 RepID=A0A8J7W001_9FIRM|nr:DUF6179 domain-containing protein [Sinanaerobacter chloroacetimidivorans]MBR0597088.1 hypothetical protein [Sinanaerobacter chloroacetimidivorans]
MNNIEKTFITVEKPFITIEKDSMNAGDFFQGLLEKAFRINLLSKSEIEKIQLQIIRLMAVRAERYTNGESSSVTVETGQSLHQTIFYTLGFYFKSLPNIETCIEMLKKESVSDLYQKGLTLLEQQFHYGKCLLESVNAARLTTDLMAYNDTLDQGLPPFFSCYDFDFAAQENPGSVDYPLALDKTELTGIEYMNHYLETLLLENQFCIRFSNENIHHLLRGYDPHYQELLINIFFLVFTNALGAVLTDRSPLELDVSVHAAGLLQQKLSPYSKEELENLLKEAVMTLCLACNLSEPKLQQYLLKNIRPLAARLKQSLEKNRIGEFFISFRQTDPSFVLQYTDDRKMNDTAFRTLADAIRECRYVSDKIAILKSEVASIADIIDLLEGSCFFEKEYDDVFKALEETELAILLKKLPIDPILKRIRTEDINKDWQYRFYEYLDMLDPAKKETLYQLSFRIQLG